MTMDQDNQVAAPTTGASAAATPATPAPRGKWTRVAWGVIAVVAIVTGITQLYDTVQNFFYLPSCDSQRAKDTLSNIFKEHKFEPKGYDSIKTVSSSKDEVVCNAVLPLPDGADLVADYSFYWEGSSAKVKYSMHRKAP